MNERWQQFLLRQGAIADRNTLHFGSPTDEVRLAATSDVIVVSTSQSLLRARGDDATTFLHGQLSNDIRGLDVAHSRLASYNSPQGRMYAVLRVYRRNGDILLRLPATIAADVLRRLRMYVLRSRVTLENQDAELVALGISGPNARALTERTFGAAPGEVDDAITAGGVTLARVPGPFPRFEAILAPDAAAAACERLRSGCAFAGDEAASWLDVAAAVPAVTPATSEAFVPQMANLDLLNGISFGKGCYPGQEIVARMQYLGRLKQRMFRAHVSCDIRPQPGESLFSNAFGDQPAGTVVMAAVSPNGGYDLLAVAQTAVSGTEVRLARPGGPILAYLPMPYPLPPQQ